MAEKYRAKHVAMLQDIKSIFYSVWAKYLNGLLSSQDNTTATGEQTVNSAWRFAAAIYSDRKQRQPLERKIKATKHNFNISLKHSKTQRHNNQRLIYSAIADNNDDNNNDNR
jgi:hypothetical protein